MIQNWPFSICFFEYFPLSDKSLETPVETASVWTALEFCRLTITNTSLMGIFFGKAFCFLEWAEVFEIDYTLLNFCLGSSKSPYNLSDTVEFIFLYLSFLIKDIDRNFCDSDQQKTLADMLITNVPFVAMETLCLCPCGKNVFPLDKLIRFLMDPRRGTCIGHCVYVSSWPSCSLESS